MSSPFRFLARSRPPQQELQQQLAQPISTAINPLSHPTIPASDSSRVSRRSSVASSHIQEEALLSQAELERRVARDLYGNVEIPADTSHAETALPKISLDRQYLNSAFETLDPASRGAFDTAQKQCPDLVERESNLLKFLRACECDYWATARRVANYWQQRLDVFGPDRAFLPLSLTGEGALSPRLVAAMKESGAFTLIPSLDASQRPVTVLDQTRYTPACEDPIIKRQILFYLWNMLFLESDEAMMNGGVMVYCLDTTSEGAPMRKPSGLLSKLLLTEAIPVKLCAVHVLVVKKKSFLNNFLPSWIQAFHRFKYVGMRTVIHMEEDRDEFLLDVEEYGLTEDHVPTTMGGSLDTVKVFNEWYNKHFEIDLRLYPVEAVTTHDEEFGALAELVLKDYQKSSTTGKPRASIVRGGGAGSQRDSNAVKAVASRAMKMEKTIHKAAQKNRKSSLKSKQNTSSVNSVVSSTSSHFHYEGVDYALFEALAAKALKDYRRFRKREVDKIYQRKKRMEESHNLSQLQQKAVLMGRQKSRLLAQQRALQSALSRAQRMAGELDRASTATCSS